MGFFNLFKKAVKATIKNAERNHVYTQKSNENIIRQLFETMHILLKTNNYKTYLSRLELFDERIDQFQVISKTGSFRSSYNESLSKYRLMYYDRNSTTNKIEAYLKTPNEFNKIHFFEDTFYRLLDRIKLETKSKIIELKTEKAKENKKETFKIKVNEALIFLKEKGYDENCDYVLKFKDLTI